MAKPAVVDGKIDPSRSIFVSAFGMKGYGKSTLCRHLFNSWPYDRLVVDVTGDEPREPSDARDNVVELEAPLPHRWPGKLDRRQRQTLRFKPDPGSATYREDMDNAVGLAYTHGKSLVWVDEVGEVCQASKTWPWMRRALQQGRHRDLSLLMAGPRPVNIDPLVIAQSDLVYVFRLPNPNDRRRVAETIGWDREEFDAGVLGLPKFGYLRYSAEDDELVEFPPLPM